ncbi:hypothetical protein RRSWK_05894 [Rhodopirellula sp. SWK7]|nr:hypothetical protein RRSWK_05894 [Rhodopirellula sp. SWK7]
MPSLSTRLNFCFVTYQYAHSPATYPIHLAPGCQRRPRSVEMESIAIRTL